MWFIKTGFFVFKTWLLVPISSKGISGKKYEQLDFILVSHKGILIDRFSEDNASVFLT